MTKYTSAEVNCETGVMTERELTPEEVAAHEEWVAGYLAMKEAEKVEIERIEALKESAKAKLVAGEALTEEEASVLVIQCARAAVIAPGSVLDLLTMRQTKPNYLSKEARCQ